MSNYQVDTSSLAPLGIEDFAAFYQAAHGYKPFAWQERLAKQVCLGAWPEYLKLPTSSGKTAAIDIAVFALAYQACEANRPDGLVTAARRIFFVVDRRIIVNEAYRQTRQTAELLWKAVEGKDPGIDPILPRVGLWLQSLANDKKAPPLDCFELRGGIYRDDAWVRSPLQPTVLTSTVDQVGSRMLFRGYGVSDRNLPIHAAMTACDSLIILDEAHCSKPFSQTVASIDRYRGEDWADEPIATPFTLVQMTATPPSKLDDKSLFTLSDHDYEVDDLLEKRHACAKPITLEHEPSAKGKALPVKLAKKLVAHAHALANSGCKRVAVVVNRVAIARETFKLLHAKHGGDASLMIGRMRPIDRDELTRELQKKFGSGSNESFAEPQFVVATQCLEVGADLDFDGMVCQCASLDALQQRFGRLNRLGNATHAHGVIVAAEGDVPPVDKLKDDKPADPVYGNALACTWHWLNEVKDEQGEIDFGIKALDELLDHNAPEPCLTAPSSDAPVLMPAHLDMLCQTSPRPTPEPDVAAYLHGPESRLAEVRVCWRADLKMMQVATQEDRHNRSLLWTEAVAVCPPSSAECLSVPLHLVKQWLRGESLTDATSDVLGEQYKEDDSLRKIKANSHGRCVLVWQGKPRRRSNNDQSENNKTSDARSYCVYERDVHRLRPNATLVIPAEFGGWRELGYVPHAPVEPVPDAWMQEATEKTKAGGDNYNEFARIDVADLAFTQSRARTILRVHQKLSVQDSAKCLFDLLIDKITKPDADLRTTEIIKELKKILDSDERKKERTISDGDDAGRDTRRDRLIDMNGARAPTLTRYPDGIAWTTALHPDRATGMPLLPLASFGDEDDSLSETGRLPLLQHLADVFAEAARLAEALSLPKSLEATIVTAAKLHDIGKADPRFQAMLLAKPVSVAYMQRTLWAKSDKLGGSRSNELPSGFRHEMLTVDLLERLDDGGAFDRELLAHLEASHHGYARPLAPMSVDDSLPGFSLNSFGVDAVSHEERSKWTPSHQLDSGVAERFWNLNRRFGWWGLAYFESLLRLADWSASASPGKGEVSTLSFSATSNSKPTTLKIADQNEVVLTGIDGSRPLGFLSALGVFNTLASGPNGTSFRFSWRRRQGAWRPVVLFIGGGPLDDDILVDSLFQQLQCEPEKHPSLRLAEAHGDRREHFQKIADAATLHDRVGADWLSCNGSDAATPDAISQLQTSRRDYHSIAIRGLLEKTTPGHLTRTLFDSWDYADPIAGVSLHLEPREDRRHAYQWHTPSGDPTRKSSGGMIGANRLALEAWPLFQSLPAGDRMKTVGFRGIRVSNTRFTWPLWGAAIPLSVIRTLLSHCGLQGVSLDREILAPLGVMQVYQSQRILVGKTPNITSATAVLT